MFKPKFFSILVIFLMVFSSVGGVSATVISGNVNDGHVIVVDDPKIIKIQKAVNSAKDNDIILIKGNANDFGIINCSKILTIKGENCTLNHVCWHSSKNINFENINFENIELGLRDYSLIDSDGSVTMNNCTCRSQVSTNGGAIYSDDSVTISNSNFTNCSAYASIRGNGKGGAIYANEDVNVEGSSFCRCEVDEEKELLYLSTPQGGAIYSDDGSVVLKNSRFIDNSTYEDGGAIYADNEVIVQDCLFGSNTVDCGCGGAIYADDMDVKITNSNFTDNSVSDNDGGAIWSNEGVSVDGCSFVNNFASDNGGAVYSDDYDVKLINSSFSNNYDKDSGGAVWSDGFVEVNGCSFVNNSASGASGSQCEGGAVYSDGGGVKIINSKFIENYAYDYGGAVWSDDGVTVENSSFMDNFAEDNRGGAIYMDDDYDLRVSGSSFYGNCANDKGGAIYCEGNSAHVYLDSYNSFENNTAKEGSVVFADGYFESIKCNWWGECCPDWDDGLLVEWKAWPWDNVKHHDESPLDHNPNL